jgi:hypothetical protein
MNTRTRQLTRSIEMKEVGKIMLRGAASVAMASIALLLVLSTATADAAVTPAPRWEVNVVARPNHLTPTATTSAKAVNQYEVELQNIGGAPSLTPTKVELEFSPGITVTEFANENNITWNCTGSGTSATCESFQGLRWASLIGVHLEVSGPAREVSVKARVTGGEAPTVEQSFTNQVSEAPSPFEISAWKAFGTDPAGNPFATAAGHPNFFNTLLTVPSVRAAGEEGSQGAEFAKDIVVDLPPGLIGNPAATPLCSIPTFFASEEPECPPASQVGSFSVSGQGYVYHGIGLNFAGDRNPIYNLTPEPGYPAELGFFDTGLGLGVVAQGELVHSDQGYVVRVAVPSAPKGLFGPWYLQTSFFGNPEKMSGSPVAGKPFLTYPSSCTGQPLRTTTHIDTWSNPAPLALEPSGAPDFESANFADPRWHNAVASSPAVTGCEGLRFKPSVAVAPDSSSSDSPTGLAFDLKVPQDEEPEGQGTPPLRDATVALPQGLVTNPSVADGLAGCTAAQLAPDSTKPGACPPGSKIGSVSLRTPLIDHPLAGSLYIGTPECSPCTNADAASGRLLKLYLEVDDPATGVVVKLPGSASADPTSGQLTATFTENPQLPFEELELNLYPGPRAPLTTPSTCGEYTTTTDLEPWSAPQSGPDAAPQSRFSVTSGPGGRACGGLANAPAFEAGTTTPLAATYSPFVFKVSRENGSQRISSLDTTLPEGLLGKLAGVPYCSDAQIAAAAAKSGTAERSSPSCPAASEVGTVNVGAGSGAPFYVQGHAYLAGPYKGAPLSLEIITPAVAGPFDLGTVAVRAALYVNPLTAQIHAVSDPIPQILAGVPLDVRSIALNMNRPQFILNPTSCDPMAILGSTTSTLGQTATLQSRFQVGGCNGLAFKPKLALRLSGSTQRGKNPALRAVLTQAKGQANIHKVSVVLPKSEFIDNRHINNPCTRVQFNAGGGNGAECPAKSILGKATAYSPLLEAPLSGPVYFRSNGGERELPDLVASLGGQVHLNVVGFVDSVGKKGSEVSRVRNTFAAVPDAPVSKFVLELKGGKKGLLQNSANLCKVGNVAQVKFTGQNGKFHDFGKAIANSCKSKGKRSKRST